MSDLPKGVVTVNVMTIIQGLTEEDKEKIGEDIYKEILKKLEKQDD